MTRFALSASPALSFLLSLVACGGNDSDERPCTDSSECIKGGEPGQCLPSPESNQSWCAFDDGACNSSLRWGSLTGDGLADECVDEGDIIPDAGMPDAGVDAGISDAGPGDDGGETDAMPPGGAFVRGFGSTGDDIAFALDTFGTDVIVAGVFEETVDFGGGDLVSAGNQDGFVAKYGADGAFVWSRRFGGTSIDKAFGVAVDSVGDVFVAGEFLGTASFGGSDLTSAGIRDAFIAKYDAATGAHVWSCRIGGADTDIAKAITSDGTDVIVVGSFRGTVDFGGGAVSSNGSTDAFVAKYSGVDCSHVWSRAFGGTSIDEANGVDVDGAGAVAVVGTFASTSNFGGSDLTAAGLDVFIAKYDGGTGAHVWSDSHGGASTERAKSVAVVGGTDVVIAGDFDGTANFGGADLTPNGSRDVFVAKYAGATGAHQWSRSYGGAGSDIARAVTDDAGEVLVAGEFAGTVNFGGSDLTSAGAADVFVARYLPADGSHVFSQAIGGANSDIANAASTGLVAGSFQGTVDFGIAPLTSAGNNDVFVVRIEP